MLSIALIGAVAALGVLQGSCGAARAQQSGFAAEMFVTNFSANSVTVYQRTASGNAAPVRTLSGDATGLAFPAGLAVDTVHDEVWVVNLGTPSIAVYSRGASGNSAPLRTISGPTTGLAQPIGLALDLVHDEILVTNSLSITAYRRTASGDTAPLRTITGPATGLDNPLGVAVDPTGDEVFVANRHVINVYSRTATGNAPPLRTITVGTTDQDNAVGIALDTVNDEITVTNRAANTLAVYSRIASGDAAPLRVIAGAGTGLAEPLGVTVDVANNELVVANLGGSEAGPSITVYARTASGNASPLRTLSGGSTGLAAPAFVDVIHPCARTFSLDFADQEYPDCFRELVRGNEISDGPDLGGTGQFAVNFKGVSGSTPSVWLTIYDPADEPAPTYGAGTVCADVLIVPFNNAKGAGVVSLMNEGVGKKGLGLVVHEAGNTDTLLLMTLDGDPTKNGKPTTLTTVSLNGGIAGRTCYRVVMTTVEDRSTTPSKWTVTGKVFRHATATDPNSRLAAQVGSTLTYRPATLPAGVTSPGELGIMASSVAAVLNASVTNFSNDPVRCGQ